MATCFFLYRLFFEPLSTVVSLWCGILTWREFIFSVGLTLAAWGCLGTIMFSRNFYFHTYVHELEDPKAANYIFNVGPALVWATVFVTAAIVYHYDMLLCRMAVLTDWQSYLFRTKNKWGRIGSDDVGQSPAARSGAHTMQVIRAPKTLGILATLLLLGGINALCGVIGTYANFHRHIFLQMLFVGALIFWTFSFSRWLIPKEQQLNVNKNSRNNQVANAAMSVGRTSTKTIKLGRTPSSLDMDEITDASEETSATTTYRRMQITRQRRRPPQSDTDPCESTHLSRAPWPANSFALIGVAVVVAAVPHWIRNYNNALLDAEEARHRHNEEHHADDKEWQADYDNRHPLPPPPPTPMPSTPVPPTPSPTRRYPHRLLYGSYSEDHPRRNRTDAAGGRSIAGLVENKHDVASHGPLSKESTATLPSSHHRLTDAAKKMKKYFHVAARRPRAALHDVVNQWKERLQFLNQGRSRHYAATWFSNFEFRASATYYEYYDLRHVEVQWLLFYYLLAILLASLPSLWLVLQARFMILSENLALTLFHYDSSIRTEQGHRAAKPDKAVKECDANATPPPTPTVALLAAHRHDDDHVEACGVRDGDGITADTARIPIPAAKGPERNGRMHQEGNEYLDSISGSARKRTDSVRRHPPTAFGIKLTMWAGESLVALILTVLVFPLDFFPWYHTASGAEAGLEALQRGALNLLLYPNVRCDFILYTVAFLFLRIIFGYLNRVSPTLCAFVFALYLPVHTLTLWLFPSWDVFDVHPHSVYHLLCFMFLLMAALLYLIHEAMHSESSSPKGLGCQEQCCQQLSDGDEDHDSKVKGRKLFDGLDNEDDYSGVLYEDDELIAAGFGTSVVHSSDEDNDSFRPQVTSTSHRPPAFERHHQPNGFSKADEIALMELRRQTMTTATNKTLSSQNTSDTETGEQTDDHYSDEFNWLFRSILEDRFRYRNYIAGVTGCTAVLKLSVIPEAAAEAAEAAAQEAPDSTVLQHTQHETSSPNDLRIFQPTLTTPSSQQYLLRYSTLVQNECVAHWTFVTPRLIVGAVPLIKCYKANAASHAAAQHVTVAGHINRNIAKGSIESGRNRKRSGGDRRVSDVESDNAASRHHRWSPYYNTHFSDSGLMMSPDLNLLAQACAQRQIDRISLVVSTQDLKEVRSVELRGHAVDVSDWRRHTSSSSLASSSFHRSSSDLASSGEYEMQDIHSHPVSGRSKSVAATDMFKSVNFVPVPMAPHYFRNHIEQSASAMNASDNVLVDEILTVCKHIHDIIGSGKNNTSTSPAHHGTGNKHQTKKVTEYDESADQYKFKEAVYIQCTSGGDRSAVVALCYLIYTGLSIQEAVNALSVLRWGRFNPDADQNSSQEPFFTPRMLAFASLFSRRSLANIPSLLTPASPGSPAVGALSQKLPSRNGAREQTEMALASSPPPACPTPANKTQSESTVQQDEGRDTFQPSPSAPPTPSAQVSRMSSNSRLTDTSYSSRSYRNSIAEISDFIDADISVRGLSSSVCRPSDVPQRPQSPCPQDSRHSPVLNPSSFSPSPVPVPAESAAVKESPSIDAPSHSVAYSDTIYETSVSAVGADNITSQSAGTVRSTSSRQDTNTTNPHVAAAHIVGLPGGDDETPSPSPIRGDTAQNHHYIVDDPHVTITSPPTSSLPTLSNSATPQYASTVYSSLTRASQATNVTQISGFRQTRFDDDDVGNEEDEETTTGSFTEEGTRRTHNDNDIGGPVTSVNAQDQRAQRSGFPVRP